MPNILPGVIVTPVDKSDSMILNTSVIMAMAGEFERGDDEKPTLIMNNDMLTKYFGSIENAPNKKSYVSAIQLLKEAEGVQICNITKNAKFGGIGVKASGTPSIAGFTTGVSTKDSFDFEPNVTNEVLGIGDGSSLSFSGTLAHTVIIPGTTTIHYTIGATPYTATADLTGTITGTYIASGSVTHSNGNWSLVFATGHAPAHAINITANYEYNSNYLFVLVARSKKAWSDNYGVKISAVNTDEKTFVVAEYQKNADGSETFINSYNVSRNPVKYDGFGKNIDIETVMKNESYLFYAIVNDAISYDTLPPVGTVITYAGGGVNGDAVTTVEKALAIANFDTPEIYFDYFIGAGIIDKTVIDPIVELVNKYYKLAYIDTLSALALDIVTWVGEILVIDTMRVATITPNEYVSYNGKEYLCPASALAGMKQARRANMKKGAQPFMPPSGIGEDKGSVNVVRAERYYKDAEILELHKVGVNVIKYFRSYGNVIFSDFTMQKKQSATSYINSVLTLNNMITSFSNALLVFNFKVINEGLFLQLESFIDGFIKQLLVFDGTIEPNYTISFAKNTPVTKDAGKVYVDLIFVFQSLAREITLNLVYTNNQMYPQISGV